MTRWHWLGVFFLAYVFTSALWAHNFGTSVLGIWYALVWALSFWLGTTLSDLRQLWQGLAYGAVIASLVAVFQWLGADFPVTMQGQISGLYFNSTVLGAVCALMLVACLCHRLWWPIPFLAAGLALSHSRGGLFILAVGLCARIHWLLALACALAGFAIISHLTDPSDLQRMEIWGVALHGMSPFGWGPDSFNDLFAMLPRRPDMTPSLYHLEFAHNDYLQLAFEYGLVAIAPITILAAALRRTQHPDFSILAAWGCLALFYFPLYAPLLAFIGCVCAGHLLRPDDALRPLGDRWGQPILPWHNTLEARMDRDGLQTLPLATRTSHTEA
jgi:MFS family permease